MPKLIIDNIPVEVTQGKTVLEAAKSVGITIPHFCWHPALGKAGACRVCAVKMVDGPVKGIQMSCMLEAQDGMVVSTTDAEAMAMRKQVIEWLMINHPHDCPVCDEGGECQLQDYTIAGGHGLRRYTGKKRTHVNQYLGPHIEHEMNRCIQCYRCVRFYQEFAGGTDFGVMGSAGRIYYGRVADGPLESPFAGNLVDICPTGVFTDKTARFRARYWDYDMAPSVCPHCSLGCNTVPAARYRELLKVIARQNDAVNGWFLCDKGRFTNSAVNAPERPRVPLIDGRQVAWEEALAALLLRIREIGTEYGAESLAIVGSSGLSMEAASLLHLLHEKTGAGSLCYFVDAGEAQQSATVTACLNEQASASMADIQAADLIALVECDLLQDGPMMALAVRQAWRRGAKISLVEDAAGTVAQNDNGLNSTDKLPFEVERVASLIDIPFADAAHPVIIFGGGDKMSEVMAEAGKTGAKLACLLGGPNSFGAALLAKEYGAISLAEAVADKKVRAVVSVEADIPPELLPKLVVVATLDWRNTETVKAAHIVLPTTAWVEMDGTYINNEGRAQRFKKVMQPGLPIKGLNPSLHPPREHTPLVPGGQSRPAWEILVDIVHRLGSEEDIQLFAGQWQRLRDLDATGNGLLLTDIERGIK
ncbi:NADH-quinone oxidoreductase subunit NuoG [Desulfopila sp. IMCC35006]|uniref:NADH-quinone oxidoreductase subunit NuoG n=1 Tax=Desulfopila sp. IMCC35006 TaxID=2569542 RepID=UPI0010AD01F0|nr:NADH-quinone oxidoreductase subunit NuoG [Desulfopila sp. IMCC35006]TKB28334.1 NADH-quinone oxidoreductase subunit NuoG [Desulfopila sp. IMCC35006]